MVKICSAGNVIKNAAFVILEARLVSLNGYGYWSGHDSSSQLILVIRSHIRKIVDGCANPCSGVRPAFGIRACVGVVIVCVYAIVVNDVLERL